MQNKLRRHGQVVGESGVAVNAVSRGLPPPGGVIGIGPTLECSWVTKLSGRPYPIQFRNQGAIDAWTRAPGKTEVWQRWQDPGTLCWQIRQARRSRNRLSSSEQRGVPSDSGLDLPSDHCLYSGG